MSSQTKRNSIQPQPSATPAIDGHASSGAYSEQSPVAGGQQPDIFFVQPARTVATPVGQTLSGQRLIAQGLIPVYPAGLEPLTLVDKLFVMQREKRTRHPFSEANKYDIVSETGKKLYFAREEADECGTFCCGPRRCFVMHILDSNRQEVISVNRGCKCFALRTFECFACLGCCAHEVQIEAPPGNVIGYIQQTRSCWIPRFVVQDEHRETVLKIDGPRCTCQNIFCCEDVEFHLNSRDGEHEVGMISKKYDGICNDLRSAADTFDVSFPMDLDVKMKAVLIGAVILIDNMFFEFERHYFSSNPARGESRFFI